MKDFFENLRRPSSRIGNAHNLNQKSSEFLIKNFTFFGLFGRMKSPANGTTYKPRRTGRKKVISF